VTSNPNPQTENFNSFIYNFTNSINYPTSLGVRFVMGDIISFSQKSPYQTPGKMYNLLAELRKTQKIDEIELDQDKYKINSYLIPQELNIILGWIDIGLYSNSIVGSIMNIFSKKSFVEGMKYCIDQKQYQRIGIALNIFGILKLKCILGDLIQTTYNAVANKATTQHVLGDLVSDITIKIELDILSLSN
jgi:hypothetical protein